MILRLLASAFIAFVLLAVFNAYLSPDMRVYFFQQLPFCS